DTVRRRLRESRLEAIEVAQEDRRRESQPLAGRGEARRKLRPEGTEVEPMRMLLELPQREPMWPEAEQQIEEPPFPEHARGPQRRPQLAAAPAATVAAHTHCQVEQHLEVAAHPGRPRYERLHVARGVAHRKRVEDEVVVVALEPEAGGQDEV